jgi:hypothetical protein
MRWLSDVTDPRATDSKVPFYSATWSETGALYVALRILTAVTINSTIVWDVTPYILVEFNRCFGGNYCLHPLLDVCFLLVAWPIF